MTGAGAAALAVVACALITIGLLWDISWHAAIGRDSFWTPAHVAIYAGGVLAGAVALRLGWAATFRRDAARLDDAVTLWKLRAPFGAWVIGWGGGAMLTAGPFDSWWHDAYGLDVAILTPAHSVLSTGMVAVHAGAMLLATSALNRSGRRDRGASCLVTLAASFTLLLAVTLLMEYSYPNQQHGAPFYVASAIAYPVVLVSAAGAGRGLWQATRAAGAYMALGLAMLWILPLFPAEPRLAPIFNPVRHMWPGLFPLLLVVPAAAVDLISRRRPRRALAAAALFGLAFLASFAAVQWPFSAFLLTPAARNPIFAADQWYFMVTHTQEGRDLLRLDDWRYTFWAAEEALRTAPIAAAASAAVASSAAGLWWGGVLRRVER